MNSASRSVLFLMMYNVAPSPAGLTAPSVTTQSLSSGHGRVMVLWSANDRCTVRNCACSSFVYTMWSLDCFPAVTCSRGWTSAA